MALAPTLQPKTRPDTYAIERSQREREEEEKINNPPVPYDDEYNYQDISDLSFPFFIDTSTLIFMGRIGEEPVHAHFTINNQTHAAFWYKIKASCSEMFKIRTAAGKLEKNKKTIITVIFYPNFKRPKPFCEYLNVHPLYDNGRDTNVYEAFKRLDCQRPFPRKRIYLDFVYHPHIGLTQAHENGKVMEMMKSKLATNRWRHTQYVDVTYQNRQRWLNKMMEVDREEKHSLEIKPTPDVSKHFAEIEKNKNRSKIAGLLKKLKKEVDYQKLHVDSEEPIEYAKGMWNEYTNELEKKNYKNTKTRLKIEENPPEQKKKEK